MKALILSAALLSSSAFAAESKNLIYTCSNGEEITVRLYDTDTAYRATVTVQSTGDSYPTFKYNNIQTGHGKKRFGGPLVYFNSKFRMAISHVQGTKAILDIPSLGIEAAKLKCE